MRQPVRVHERSISAEEAVRAVQDEVLQVNCSNIRNEGKGFCLLKQ
jgi:hypothetical protein